MSKTKKELPGNCYCLFCYTFFTSTDKKFKMRCPKCEEEFKYW